MNVLRVLLFVLFIAGAIRAQGVDTATPPATPEPARPEMEKWLATTQAPWQAIYKRDVTDAYENELDKVQAQYLSTLDNAIAKASTANDLDGALALRSERKRFADAKTFPAEDDDADAASVKQIRATFRPALTRLETDRVAHAKEVQAKLDRVLAQAQAQLTQHQHLDDALLVKKRREEIAAQWLAPSPTAQAPTTAATAGTQPPATPVPAPGARTGLASSPPPAAPTTGQQLAKRLANTKWGYSLSPNDPLPPNTVTIHASGTVSWGDNPKLHVEFRPLDARTIQVKDHIWIFAPDLESFTIHSDRNAPPNRYGTRIHGK